MSLTPPTPDEIRAFRALHNLTQAEFAFEVASSKRAVEDWEAGRREPPAMLRLAMNARANQLGPWSEEAAKHPYRVFDQFLAASTWASGHWLDDQRFFRALAEAVHNRAFSPDGLGDYMRAKVGNKLLENAVDRFVGKADAVVDYMRANGQLDD